MTREEKMIADGQPSGPSSVRSQRINPFLQDVEPFLQGRKLVYVDVGAYRGGVFDEIRKFPLPIHEAHLLEPNPTAFAALQATAKARRGPGRAVCYNLAISDQPGLLRFRDAESMTQAIGIVEESPETAGERSDGGAGENDVAFAEGIFETRAITLDQLAERLPDRRISLLKIDVEGHERQVLAGARGLLEANAIDLIYIEAGMDPASRQQTYYRDIEDTLAGHGYRLFGVYEQHNRWLEDSPLLRRVNLAFMSTAFAAQNPYQVSRDLLNLRREAERLTAQIEMDRALAAAEAAEREAERAATAERLAEAEALRAEAEGRVGAEMERAERLQREAQAQAAEIARLAEAANVERAARARQIRNLEIDLGEISAYARELETLHVRMLRSRSWRVLEPARRLSRRLLSRKAPEPFEPRLSGGAAIDRNVAERASAGSERPSLPTADLVAKLWGGFSGPASADLARLLRETRTPQRDRVEAAWNLARWSAAAGDWERCLSHLIALSKIDKTFFRAKRTRLLIVESYVRTGDPDKAIEYAEYGATKEIDGNYLCGLANALLAKARGAEEAAGMRDRERLAALNRGYAAAGLAPLGLADPAAGLVFGNLAAAATAGTVEGPKISVLVPVYNAGAFVETAIGSLLAQTWRNLEIVAVDDASVDDSWSRLQALAVRDPRLRLLRNEENLGAYPTRNRALDACTGEIVTVHDSDDWSHPQMLERQAAALLARPELKATFSMMARVRPDMDFALRPERTNLEYVHRSYPSLMMRRADLAALDRWDGVTANADDELVQRLRAAWGMEAMEDVLPTMPLSFFLRHDQSLTEQKGTHLRSLTFGIRQEYAKQAAFWRARAKPEQLASGASMARRDLKTPFPIPNGLAPRSMRRPPVYDLVIISDLGLLGGTRRCNEGYLEAATALGLRVGLFNWPRYDLSLAEVAPEYREFSRQENIDILVPEDAVEATATIIHHPPILKHPLDALPGIRTGRLGILVNQLPMQLKGAPPHYYFPEPVGELCRSHFGLDPEWIPISPLTRRRLRELGYEGLSAEDWLPPLDRELPAGAPPARTDVGAARPVVLGRHSRDHWTKWPGDAETLRAAYCADTEINVRLMGGVVTPRKILGKLPSNWSVVAFDQVPVNSFLDGVDVFLHFVHETYIEEFGRNVMEAMSRGIPTILPEDFRETFGAAARYCAPEEVAGVARGLWADPAAYAAQAAAGWDFVRRTSDQARVRERLAAFVGRTADAK